MTSLPNWFYDKCYRRYLIHRGELCWSCQSLPPEKVIPSWWQEEDWTWRNALSRKKELGICSVCHGNHEKKLFKVSGKEFLFVVNKSPIIDDYLN
jgi:hypothetical protein